MKKAKRFISAVMCAALMTSAVPFSSDAVFSLLPENKLEGYFKLEKGRYEFLEEYYTEGITWDAPSHMNGIELYMSDNTAWLIRKKPGTIQMRFLLGDNCNNDIISEKLSRYVSVEDYMIWSEGRETALPENYAITSLFIFDTSITIADMKSFCKELTATGGVAEIIATVHADSIDEWRREGLIKSDLLAFYRNEEDIVSDYLTEKGIGFKKKELNKVLINEKPDYYSTAIQFVPDEEMSQLEKVALFNDIYIDCKLDERDNKAYTGWEYLPITGGHSVELNVYDYADGDANCDNKVTVADAVAVLQYIVNREKYPMTAQGRFNADMDGEDGLTGDDVRAIQMMDAAIWDGT